MPLPSGEAVIAAPLGIGIAVGSMSMSIELRALREEDVAAHNAGEDERTIRWLTGSPSTDASTSAHFSMLRTNLARDQGPRGFGVWLDGALAGYVDCDPEVTDGLEPGDVNITYAVHAWARGRGVAGAAVDLICAYMSEHGVGTRAAIRADPGNRASIRVAEKAGFRFVREFSSATDTLPDGTPAILRLYVRDLAAVPV